MPDQAEGLRELFFKMDPNRINQVFVPKSRLEEIRRHLQAKREFQRGADGMEVPTYVLPMTAQEAESIINELLARRAKDAS
jgi:hypothetical protein